MNDPTKQWLAQLEQATSREPIRPADDETAMLRESWLMLSQMLETADADLQAPTLAVARPTSGWRWQLGVLAAIAASLLVAVASWALLRPASSAIEQPPLAAPGHDAPAAVNDGVQVAGADTRSNAASAADSAFVWDDSLDDSLAAAQNAIHDVRGGWNRGYGQVDTLLTRLQEYQQDLSENSL